MKAATIFLLAVTVFTGLLQQSSAAPNLGGGLSGLIGGTYKTVGDITGKVVDTVFGVVSALLKALLEIAVKDLKTVKVILGEIIPNLVNLPKETKEKVEAVIAIVVTELEQIIADLDKLLKNGSGVTVENIKEIIAQVAQVDKEIKANFESIIPILEKCDEDASSVISIVKSVLAKATEDVDVIKSNLLKALEALLAEKIGATDNISDKFKQSLVENIQNSNKCLAKIIKAIEDGWNDATGDEKVAMEKCKTFMDNFTALCDNLHSKLASAALSGDKTGLQDLRAPIKEVIADTKKKIAEFLENLGESMKHIVEENINEIMLDGDKVIVLIDTAVDTDA